ncbi:MAG: hypothetical protein K2N63_16230 [Lachnospiraceae bacterium]|nr:hypothetical protein [Lachnospiraceae bacterium]
MSREENLILYNHVRSVPSTAKKTIQGGRMHGKTSIEAMWRIKVLTEQFGPCGLGWYYVPVKKWMESAGEELLVFVDIELYVKFENEWSKPIYGTGGGKLVSKETKGINTSEECYKMATTDALSVACKQLGIGADVYWDKDKDSNKYSSAPASSASHFPDPEQKSGMAGKGGSPALEERYVHSLWRELKRTGVGVNSLLRNYKKCTLQELDFEEYKDAMYKLTAKADKPKPDEPLHPQNIPPDDWEPEGLPWNRKDEKESKEKDAPMQEESLLSSSLIEDGYSYCGSFGGN